MIKPTVWGQGALFAMSGLCGRTDYASQWVCTLLGDHPGLHVMGEGISFELYADTTGVRDIVWDTVASDVIIGRMLIGGEWTELAFVMLENDCIAGICPDKRLRLNVYEGSPVLTQKDGCFIVSAKDHPVSPADIQAEAAKRAGFFDGIADIPVEPRTAAALAHAISVMKCQVYTPEGQFKQLWTTPDRYPHKKLWLWDSCFHSLGNRLISDRLAEDSILSVLDTICDDGFIPHMADPSQRSAITQPPVIAWAVERYVRRTGKVEFAARCLPAIERYLKWDMDNRRTASGLYYWHINRANARCRCDESGMDNCSSFDDVEEMECIDFACFMVREAEAAAYLHELTGNKERAEYLQSYAKELKGIINARLWDEADGFYYDIELKTGELHKVKSVASFLPLFAGVCDDNQKARLLDALDNEALFRTPVAVPGIAVTDPTFGQDMWCGPVWINFVYFVIEGLYRAGETLRADALVKNTVGEITKYVLNDGVFFEFYDSLGITAPDRLQRKGDSVQPYTKGARMQTIRDYGWTATLFAAMVAEHAELFR